MVARTVSQCMVTSLPNILRSVNYFYFFPTHGASLARFTRDSSAIKYGIEAEISLSFFFFLEISLLMGNDAPQVSQPIEVCQSQHGGPYATCTIFGWTLNGLLGRSQPKIPTANFADATADLTKMF